MLNFGTSKPRIKGGPGPPGPPLDPRLTQNKNQFFPKSLELSFLEPENRTSFPLFPRSRSGSKQGASSMRLLAQRKGHVGVVKCHVL